MQVAKDASSVTPPLTLVDMVAHACFVQALHPAGRKGQSVPCLQVERVAKVAFDLASKRSGRLCSVDKANVLECSRLWREVVTRVGEQYPNVELSHM